MTKRNEFPQYYFISKGTAQYNPKEGVTEVECYRYEITKGEDGWLIAQCPELHAVTQGKIMKELKDNIVEVHSLMLEST